MSTIKLYYDGGCPFCREYTKYMKLKQKHNLIILNARDNPKDIQRFKDLGFNINDGFIIELNKNGNIYIGADAVKVLDDLINQKNFLEKIMSFIVNMPIFKTTIYPLIKIMRKILLKVLKIDSNI